MSLPDNFVIVDGLMTVEAILQPSWIIRKRIDDSSLTSPYVWVATMAQTGPGECEVKGYLAKDSSPMTLGDYKALRRIGKELKFATGKYDRVENSGEIRKTMDMWRK